MKDLEMQNVMGNGNAMEDNAAGAGSEKDTTMPPELEADSVSEVVSVEESREDDDPKNLKVVS